MEDNEIKVGEYVRTISGKIAKVCAYQDLTTYDNKGISVTFHSFDTNKGTIADIDIKKHSFDKTDLVEPNDLIYFNVNGLQHCDYAIVRTIKSPRTLKEELRIGLYKLEQVDIKSIITHEQLKANEYRFEEEK